VQKVNEWLGFGRLEDGLRQASDWYLWGPYLSERQWGTVREDYSADGEAWGYLPHDHARSRIMALCRPGWPGASPVTRAGLPLWPTSPPGHEPRCQERVIRSRRDCRSERRSARGCWGGSPRWIRTPPTRPNARMWTVGAPGPGSGPP
jgi:hypothetical protein